MMGWLPDIGSRRPLRLLCLGAHSDDLEIGCAGTILALLHSRPSLEVTWVVLSAADGRADEARRSARALLGKAARSQVVIGEFSDSYFPAEYRDLKGFLEKLRSKTNPDVVFTHRLDDRHQDHRLVAELTWNAWRDHPILEYEIPKYEGDLGRPNVFVPIPARLAQRKARHLARYFASQRHRSWFNAENFLALMRLRGLECRAPSGFAEAFDGRKVVLSMGSSPR
ncbi:MAG: PIG-L deacetylase family protein [Steroidobacteraceae bacterium]